MVIIKTEKRKALKRIMKIPDMQSQQKKAKHE
jgi:hypothetical protein